MKYDDLLQVPYRLGGRGIDGLDCYGLVLECFRRDGKALKDLALPESADIAEHVKTLNVREVADPGIGRGIQFLIDGKLHIGYMLSRRAVLHMTEHGLRITPLTVLSRWTPRFFEVVSEGDGL